MSKTNNSIYIWAIITMTLITVTATVLISIFRPDQDNTALITLIFGAAAPTTLSLLAFMKAQQTHVLVNSRMSEFIKVLNKNAQDKSVIAKAEGVVEGRILANKRTDLLKK